MFRVWGLSAVKLLKQSGSSRNLLPISSLKFKGLKIYTKTGDKGKSSLFNGQRRYKTDPVFDALGTVDELSSSIGIAHGHIIDIKHASLDKTSLLEQLLVIQSRLQDIGACVATPTQGKAPRSVSFSPEAATIELESWIDKMTNSLPPLTQFILPSGGKASASLHFSRAVCRRAERSVLLLNESDSLPSFARNFSGDEIGRGAGKGGGSGGSIREAGGSFGKREAALEGEYFHRLEVEQIKEFKKHLEEEVSHHKAEIKRHKEAIERHEKKMKRLAKI